MIGTVSSAWGIKWKSDNGLDGKREHLIGVADHPSRTLLFKTRHEARAYRRQRFGYIADRPDLQAEPHGWQMPEVVRVVITVDEAA